MQAKLSDIRVWPLVKQAGAEWSEDKVPKMAASLAYYTVSSLAPLLVAALGISTLFAGHLLTPDRLQGLLKQFFGDNPEITKVLSGTIETASKSNASWIATALSVVVALFSAGGLFGELQDSLNTIWEVKPKPDRGIKGLLRDRFISMSMVLGVAFLLLVSTILTAVVSGVSSSAIANLFGGSQAVGGSTVVKDLTWIGLFVITTAVVTVLFAAIFKILPDVIIAWRDVWLGAFLTALMFQLGKLGLSQYLSRFSPSSAFGAVGSIVVLIVWVYYSAQILYFGAEFTQVFANQYGTRIVPAKNAMPLTEEMRKQAGIPHAADSASLPAALRKPMRRPVGPRPMLVSTPAMRTRGALLMAATPVAVGVVVGRFAYRRLRGATVKSDKIGSAWSDAARQWGKFGKLIGSSKGDRYAMTHGPAGETGPSWAEVAAPLKK